MSSKSDFVRQIHLDSVRTMLQDGTTTEEISAHLKRVWCDEEEIDALLNEAQLSVWQQALLSEPL
jgi:glycerol-3-phosphate dehydrogenase